MGAGSGAREGLCETRPELPCPYSWRLRNRCIPPPSPSPLPPGAWACQPVRAEGSPEADQNVAKCRLFPRGPPPPTNNTSPLSPQSPPINGQRLPGLKAPPQAVRPHPAFEPRDPEARNHWFQQERDLQKSNRETEHGSQPCDLLPSPSESPSATWTAQNRETQMWDLCSHSRGAGDPRVPGPAGHRGQSCWARGCKIIDVLGFGEPHAPQCPGVCPLFCLSPDWSRACLRQSLQNGDQLSRRLQEIV